MPAPKRAAADDDDLRKTLPFSKTSEAHPSMAEAEGLRAKILETAEILGLRLALERLLLVPSACRPDSQRN